MTNLRYVWRFPSSYPLLMIFTSLWIHADVKIFCPKSDGEIVCVLSAGVRPARQPPRPTAQTILIDAAAGGASRLDALVGRRIVQPLGFLGNNIGVLDLYS
jgi:hypothetical protein